MATETRALSPEVASLFETIKGQAHKYAELMEQLEAYSRDIEAKQRNLELLVDSVHSESQEMLLDIRKSAESTLRAVDSKSARINTIYDTLDKMQDSVKEAAALNRQLEEKVQDFDSQEHALATWQAEAEKSLTSTLHETFHSQLQSYRQEVTSLRQQVQSITDLATRNLHTVKEELSEFKSKFPNPDIMAQEARYEVKILRAEMNEHFNKVLTAFKDEAQHILDHAWEQEKEMTTRMWDEESIDKEIRALRDATSEAKKNAKVAKAEVTKLRGMQMAAIVTAMIGVAIAVVALSF